MTGFVQIDKYNGAAIDVEENYEPEVGHVFIAAAWRGDKGAMPKWCQDEFGKGNWKKRPKKIKIGKNREEAIAVLRSWIAELEGGGSTQEDDAPF